MDDLEEKLRRLLKEEEEKKKKVNWLNVGIAFSKFGKAMQTPEAQKASEDLTMARINMKMSTWEFCNKYPDNPFCPAIQPLIYQYAISEGDLYILGVIQEKKATSLNSYEKSKLNGKVSTILAKYNVGFFKTNELMDEIKFVSYQTNPELIEKYGKIDLDTIKSKNNSGCVFLIVLIILIFLLVWF
ncbi:MAG: hypothetical protein ACOVNZ_01585, partial [Crocinitomicaceae bacterium]